MIAWIAFPVQGPSITAAELEAAAAGHAIAAALLDDPVALGPFLEKYTPWSFNLEVGF